MPLLGVKFDCCIVDLPYGITSNKWDMVIPFEDMWECLDRLIKGVKIFTAGQPFSALLVSSNLK